MNALRPALGRLRLKHLQLLELLSEAGSMRKAAERLNLSQPAVSQMMKEIESVFGGALFTRTRRGVVANERLAPLLRRARAALGEVAAADGELARSAAAQPTLRIGANLHLLTYLLPQAIDKLWSRQPALRYCFMEGSSARLLEALSAGELDCVIGRLLARYPQTAVAREFAFWPVYGGRLCVVVNAAHPLARRRKVRLADLAGERWALSTAAGQSRQLLYQAFLRAGLAPPEPFIECRPFYVNLTIASRLPLVTVVMRAEAQHAQQQGLLRVLPVDLDLDAPPIAFFCRKTAAGDPLIQALRQAVAETGQALDAARPARRRAEPGAGTERRGAQSPAAMP
jgi:DNA-binding transcriptional LysR family regulator